MIFLFYVAHVFPSFWLCLAFDLFIACIKLDYLQIKYKIVSEVTVNHYLNVVPENIYPLLVSTEEGVKKFFLIIWLELAFPDQTKKKSLQGKGGHMENDIFLAITNEFNVNCIFLQVRWS